MSKTNLGIEVIDLLDKNDKNIGWKNVQMYSIGHLISVALRYESNIEITLIAPVIRRADMFKEHYVKPIFFNEVLKKYPCDCKIVSNNSEEFIVIIDGTPRSLVVLPAIERTTRGLGADVIIRVD